MWKLLKRLKVLHPVTGFFMLLTGAASDVQPAFFIGLGIIVVWIIKK